MKAKGSKWPLLPLSGLYGLVTDIRNWFFTNGLFAETRPAVFTISVGNLTVGGTGKTPMTEFLIKRQLNSPNFRAGQVATLSRGYGRKTTGFRIATAADTAETIGDEPRQLFRKFAPAVRVCVGERRVDAILSLLQQYPETRQILLDDAFQHRYVRPHLTILLSDFNRPFYADYPFPAGRLRERRRGAQRADVVVVTKCPAELSVLEQQRITEQIRRYARLEAPVFFAGLRYEPPQSFAANRDATLSRVLLVSGLANADPLDAYVRAEFDVRTHRRFADHHTYTRQELDELLAALPAQTALLTTEKDWVKLDALLTSDERAGLPLYYLPVAVQFLPGQEAAFTNFLDTHQLKNP